jgi:hypothetical protein
MAKYYCYTTFFVSDFFLTQFKDVIELLAEKSYLCFQVILLSQQVINFNFLDVGITKKIHNNNITKIPILSVTNLGLDALPSYNFLTYKHILNIYIGSNVDIGTYIANVILPSKLFYETASVYIHAYGYLIQTTSGLFSLHSIFTDTSILVYLIKYIHFKNHVWFLKQKKEIKNFLNAYSRTNYQPNFF